MWTASRPHRSRKRLIRSHDLEAVSEEPYAKLNLAFKLTAPTSSEHEPVEIFSLTFPAVSRLHLAAKPWASFGLGPGQYTWTGRTPPLLRDKMDCFSCRWPLHLTL